MIKKILLMFFSLLAVTTIGIGAYGLTILNQSTNTLSKTYKGIGDENNVIAETNDHFAHGGRYWIRITRGSVGRKQ